MEIINCSFKEFKGFNRKEDILVDTGIFLGFLNKYDVWNNSIINLFKNYILNSSNELFLYINASILNEITHLLHKPTENYILKNSIQLTEDEKNTIEDDFINSFRTFIKEEIVFPLELNKDICLKHLENKNYKKFGSADSINIATAEVYGISFLTTDYRLVINIQNNKESYKNINKVYYLEK
jgi:predicted nucleic acid-binding protein